MNSNESKILNDKNDFLVVNLIFFISLKLQQKFKFYPIPQKCKFKEKVTKTFKIEMSRNTIVLVKIMKTKRV